MSQKAISKQSSLPKPISEVIKNLDLRQEEIFSYGTYKAKLSLSLLNRLQPRQGGKYIAVSAITPTPLGEGKTVNTIGLSLGLNRIGKKAICVLRQPSMGPIFGVKGGATGGGNSRILPEEEINFHLTGDFHAVSIAHNLLAAALDNSLFHGNPLQIDTKTISWKRSIDLNDRALRQIQIGIGLNKPGFPREGGFDITAASELMSILTLTTSPEDFRAKIGRIVVADDAAGGSITAESLQCAGAMALLMRDALLPTLLQSSEGTPAILHSGPFANIGPGNSSILADQMAMRLADYVVTESGFGADMGLEKLFNIKCRASGIYPDAVALIVTVRALKMHSGRFEIVAGKPLDPALSKEDLASLAQGIPNLERHIRVAKLHGVPVVIAINRFGNETQKEIDFVREKALAGGARAAVISDVFAHGGEGGVEFAKAIDEAAREPKKFTHIYSLNDSIEEKIEALATQIYGASSVSFSYQAKEKIQRFESHGWGHLPICMAKTQFSFSHDPKRKGAPSDYVFPIEDIRPMIGAGFLTPLAGEIMTMPGLGKEPAYKQMDL